MEADLDLARMASLCLARLEAVLPNRPGLGERLRVLGRKIENQKISFVRLNWQPFSWVEREVSQHIGQGWTDPGLSAGIWSIWSISGQWIVRSETLQSPPTHPATGSLLK